MMSIFLEKSFLKPQVLQGLAVRERALTEFLQKNRGILKTGIVMLAGLSLILSSVHFYRTFEQTPDLIDRIDASRIFFINIVFHLLIFLFIFSQTVIHTFQRFFTEASHPNNLSIFRIVLYWYFFTLNYSNTIALSRTPEGLRNASWQLPHWFLDYIPMNEVLITTAVGLFRMFALLACIGLLTRFSTMLAMILGFYVLGAPQYLGKLNHYHHEFWFLAIMAVSRCGDTLSCDSLIKTWKTRGQSATNYPSASVFYALPLRFIWILIGVLYFFPGFWKIWGSGLDWIVSGQLKNYLYFKWSSYNFMPPFRIDQYPLLLGTSATLTVLFELSFIVLIFSSRLRIFAVLGGIIFHKMTDVFMQIYFYSLVMCYVALVDWQQIWHWIKKKLFPGKELPVKLQYFLGYQGETPSKNLKNDFKADTPYALIVCGMILVAGNIYCGFKNYHSWPFTCYPTFQAMSLTPETSTLSMDVFDQNNGPINYNKTANQFAADNLRELLITIFHERQDKAKGQERLWGFFELCRKGDPAMEQASHIYFYVDAIDLTPGKQDQNPVRRKLIAEFHLK